VKRLVDEHGAAEVYTVLDVAGPERAIGIACRAPSADEANLAVPAALPQAIANARGLRARRFLLRDCNFSPT